MTCRTCQDTGRENFPIFDASGTVIEWSSRVCGGCDRSDAPLDWTACRDCGGTGYVMVTNTEWYDGAPFPCYEEQPCRCDEPATDDDYFAAIAA